MAKTLIWTTKMVATKARLENWMRTVTPKGVELISPDVTVHSNPLEVIVDSGLAVKAREGVGRYNGIRVIWDSETNSTTLSASANLYVYLNTNGDLDFTSTHSTAQGGLILAVVKTGASTVTSIEDARQMLVALDGQSLVHEMAGVVHYEFNGDGTFTSTSGTATESVGLWSISTPATTNTMAYGRTSDVAQASPALGDPWYFEWHGMVAAGADTLYKIGMLEDVALSTTLTAQHVAVFLENNAQKYASVSNGTTQNKVLMTGTLPTTVPILIIIVRATQGGVDRIWFFFRSRSLGIASSYAGGSAVVNTQLPNTGNEPFMNYASTKVAVARTITVYHFKFLKPYV